MSTRFLAVVVLIASLAACETAPIEFTQRGSLPTSLPMTPVTSSYAIDEAGTSIMLSDIPTSTLEADGPASGQVLHVGVLWKPLPGRTAIDPTSTNVSLRLLVLHNGEAGLYGGGGFASISGNPEDGRLALTVEGSDLRLLAKSTGFVDRLTPAQMLGEFQVTRNEAQARRMRRAATQRVTNALGSILWVNADADAADGVVVMRSDP